MMTYPLDEPRDPLEVEDEEPEEEDEERTFAKLLGYEVEDYDKEIA